MIVQATGQPTGAPFQLKFHHGWNQHGIRGIEEIKGVFPSQETQQVTGRVLVPPWAAEKWGSCPIEVSGGNLSDGELEEPSHFSAKLLTAQKILFTFPGQCHSHLSLPGNSSQQKAMCFLKNPVFQIKKSNLTQSIVLDNKDI